MDEFLKQFLIEAHELVDQGTADLLALEQQPDEPGRLDSAFRAVHTLKGAAGIVDFAEMENTLHFAEDALAAVRGGARQMDPQLIGHCLSTLDQVLDWLQVIESTGELPQGAAAASDAVIGGFSSEAAARPAQSSDWIAALRARLPKGTEPLTAVRYTPATNSFFDGGDPLAVMREIPQLLVLNIEQHGEAGALDLFDPFSCSISLSALSGASIEEVRAALPPESGLEIDSLAGMDLALPEEALALLKGQLALLSAAAPEPPLGTIVSAGRTAVAVLRHAGLEAQALQVADALPRAEAGEGAEFLTGAIERVLRGEAAPGAGLVADIASPAGEAVARSLRVDVERIDVLVRLAGELQVAKNAIGHLTRLAADGAEPALLAARLKEQQELLERLVTELQRSVVAIRVLPLRHVFQRFPKVVREMGQATRRAVRLVTEGDDTEADKTTRPSSRGCSNRCCTSSETPSTMEWRAPRIAHASGNLRPPPSACTPSAAARTSR
jgi:two-component system, chemotaxis family, sensor kinase CheA